MRTLMDDTFVSNGFSSHYVKLVNLKRDEVEGKDCRLGRKDWDDLGDTKRSVKVQNIGHF